MSTHEDTRLAARFAALAPEPLAGDWDDVLGRAGLARGRRRRLRHTGAHSGGRRGRLVVLAAAALVVVVGTASAFGTVRAFVFGTSLSAWGSAPHWSPDGQRIAYTVYRYPDGPAEVYVMNADGSGQHNVTAEWGRDVVPIWSPDWRRIAFVPYACAAVEGTCVRTAHIYVMNADGSRLHRVARAGTDRAISGGQRVHPRFPGPVWSPDGRKIAFGSERDGNVELYVMNPDGSNQRRLTRSPEAEESLTWSPDGQKIAFVRSIRGRGVTIAGVPHPGRLLRQEIYVMNADGRGQRVLARGRGPVWSPDGQKIAFRSDRDGNGEIYVMNADGSEQRRLTRNPASDAGPVWSPDGRHLLFERAEYRYGNTEIFVMNADGSGKRNLTRTPERDGSPAWSPDGRKIVFVSKRDGNGEIYVMNADGSSPLNLTRLKGSS